MVSINNLQFGYGRRNEVFSDMSLTLDGGRVHGLLGCNGVGKSTLIKLISGLLIPRKGKIEVGGYNPAKRESSLYQQMILIPEEFDLAHITFKNFVRVNSVFYPFFSHALLDHYSSSLGVDETAYLDAVSMGERKKAYIAFSLACQPRYLFMDEPTNGLDLPSKTAFKALLSSFISHDTTILISTHQVADIQNIVDSLIIMDNSGIVLNETTERIGSLLRFGDVSNDDTTLWSRDGLSGRVGVAENTARVDSVVDIELLFNAVQESRQRVIEIMNENS